MEGVLIRGVSFKAALRPCFAVSVLFIGARADPRAVVAQLADMATRPASRART